MDFSSYSRASNIGDGIWCCDFAAELDGLHYLVADAVTIGRLRFRRVPWKSDVWGTADPWDMRTAHTVRG